MIGTPIIGVIALIGITPHDAGSTLMRLHNNAITAPARAVAGSKTVWLDERNAKRAICGTTKPRNPIGPQNAVTTAVSIPDSNSNLLRVALMLTPKFSAYLAPNNKAFNGLTSINDRPSDTIINIENNGIRSRVTPVKLPIPHITNE